jgi:hypothetical protein
MQSFWQSNFIFGLVSVLIVLACIVLWLITMVVGYKAVTGESKQILGPNDFMKMPVLFLSSYLLFQVFVPFFWRFRVEKVTFASMGLLLGSRSILLWLIFIGISILIGIISSQMGKNTNKFTTLSRFIITFVQCLLIGLTEEFIFRLFLAGRIALITSPWFAVIFSTALFVLFHLKTPSEGVKRIYYYMAVVLVSFFLGFEYFYFQSIWICVISHFLIDFISFTLPPLDKANR